MGRPAAIPWCWIDKSSGASGAFIKELHLWLKGLWKVSSNLGLQAPSNVRYAVLATKALEKIGGRFFQPAVYWNFENCLNGNYTDIP